MKMLLSGILLLIGSALVVNRVLAPLYGRFDAAECRSAYAAARTHHDTVTVDLHPYGAAGSRRRLCGQLRARNVGTVADLAALLPVRQAP
jgi:hypothetical protein